MKYNEERVGVSTGQLTGGGKKVLCSACKLTLPGAVHQVSDAEAPPRERRCGPCVQKRSKELAERAQKRLNAESSDSKERRLKISTLLNEYVSSDDVPLWTIPPELTQLFEDQYGSEPPLVTSPGRVTSSMPRHL